MDASTAQGFAILPTRDRVTTNLPRFFAAAARTGMSIPGAVVVGADDYAANSDAYDRLQLPENWTVYVAKAGPTAETTQEALAEFLEAATDYVFWLADDLVPETAGWDLRCIEALNGWNFVSTNDGMLAPKNANGATVWSGDLLRAIGYMYPRGFKHWFIDTIMEEIGRATGCWTVLMDVMVRHHNANFTGARDHITGRASSYWDHDAKLFAKWMENDRLPAIERVLEVMEAHGVKMIRPDLQGVSVTIATPCGSGKYDRLYMRSLMATMEALRQYGAVVHFAEMPNCSDIVIARNRLFAAFLRGDDTHLVWIDDDQDWRPQDLVTLLLAKKAFVAVAGVRKVFPPSFAVNVSDANGQPIPIRQDAATGFLEATGVGFAFVVLSRACCERMAQHYVDLLYVNADGREELGVFNPLVVNKRYLGEDFAFCERWRAIGGKILVASEISIGHTGTYRWDGAWGQQLMDKANQEQVA